MIIVPRKNLYLPERKWGQKKFQRGIICATAVYEGVLPDPLIIDGGVNVNASGEGFVNCGNPGTTNITTAIASGGVPPYDYLWTLDGAPATKGPWVPISATDPTTNFGGSTNVCEGEQFSETWEIEVTDDDLDTATDTILVTRSWTNIS